MSKSSLQLVENELIEAREDDSSPWYVARILKVEGRRIFIHYLNWHKRHDQWLPSRSPRIRALSKKNADKLPEEQNIKSVMFKVGQAIEAKWIDKHYYPGTILSAEGNEYYRVLFSDGFKKKLRFSQIRHPMGAVEEPEPEPEPEKEEETSSVVSSRAKRLSARNSDELVSTTRSKRLSARLNRNSSSEPTSRNSSSERSRRDSSPGIITLKDTLKDSETKPSSQPKDSPPKKGSPKESPARKESPNKKETQPAKNSSPKTPAMPKKNSPKAESETKSSHTLIIDDVIEFEVPKKASPTKEKPDFKKEAPTIQIATTPVLKPHKLELTEPEPVPITDTKITKRGHSGCVDQRHKRDHSDSKISVVNSKGSRNNKQLDHSKIPSIASEKQDKSTDQKVGEKQAGTDGLKSDLMSDHISQLQRNQRDQSARLIAAKGVKEVVYQTAGYSQAAMMAGLKQGPSGPVYMPHMPGNMPHMPGMFGTPPYSQYYPVGSAGIASGQQYVARPPITSGPKLFAETIPSTTSHTNAWGMPGQYAVASSYSPAMSPHHTAGIYVTSQQFVTSSQQHHPSPAIVSPAMQSPGVAISSHPGVAISSHPIASHPGQPQGFPLEFQQRAIPQQIPQSRKTKAASEPSSSPSPSSHMSQSPSSHMSASPSHPSSHISPSPSHPGSANSPIPHHVTNATGPITAGTGSCGGAQTPPRKLEIAKTDSGKQKRNRREGSSDGSGRKSQKRGPEEPKQVRKIVKKSGNQAEALKKISYDIYDFPVSLTTKASKKTTETTKSKESDLSEESESSAGEESSSAHSTPTHHLPHQIPPPYYVNYPFYPNMQNTKITNPIHQMNMIAQQYHAQNRHHLFQQHMMHPQHKQRGRKSSHANRSAPQSPSKMRLHNQAIDANTASLLRHHHLTQQQKATGQKGPGQAAPVRYKTPEPASPASFRGMLESDEVATAGSPAKSEKSDGQQPQAYLSVMKLDKNKGQGPMIESYPVHGSFKSTVPRAPKLASPKGSQPGSPGSAVSKKTSAPSPSQGTAPQQIIAKPHFNPVTPAQIQKVSNPARLPPGYDMQQQIYRYPQPMGTYPHPGNNPAMFKPVSVPAPVPNTEEKGGQIVQPTPIMSPKPVAVSGQAPDLKPDDSISAAIQDHLTSDDLWMADDTNFDGNFDISDLANYLDGGSNSAIPDDLMDQKTEPVKPEPKDEKTVKEEPKVKQPDPASFPPTSIITAEGVRKSLRERRASAKLLESGESTIPPKITVTVPGTIPVKPNTITVLPSIETLATKPPPVTSTSSSSSSSSSQTPSQQRKPRTPISDIHGTNPSNRRASPPALNKVVPTSPLKQKLKQYVLERQARQAANRTPPRTVQSETAAHKSPGGSVGIENPLIQRRMSQSPSPTNWQQLIQYGRNSPNFIASLSPRSRDALFNIQNKDPRMSPYCRTSPVPADLTTKKEAVSPKPASSKSPRPNTKSPKSSTSSTEDPPIPTTSVQKSTISNPPLFVEPKTYIKEEPIEAPPPKTNVPVQAIQPPLEHSRPVSKSNDHTSLTSSKSVPLQIKLQSGSTEVPRLSKSVPTTPDGGYNTRKIKVQTFALLGKNPKSKKSSENLKHSPRHTLSMKAPKVEQPQADPPKPPQLQPPRPPQPQPPKSLDLKDKTPEKVIPKTENLENPFEPVFTSTSTEIISPFKDVTSRHLSIPTSFDINFDEADLFNMEVDETETKVEQNVSMEDQEQVTRPPMQADSDLTTPLVGELSLEGKGKDCLKDIVGLDSPFVSDKRRGKIGRPRSKSTISPEGDERRKSGDSDDRKKIIEPRLLLARSVISETRASKRARSSSEPFTAANIDDDHRSRKQYYYYGEPKATKAIEPLDDHLEFKCNICKKGFPKQSRLETHLKHYHEGKENVADEESDEREDIKITVRCTCDSQHEDRLMIQCDECSQWLHAICIGVNNSNIPSQYICPYCYAIVKQLHDWYEDGNLPRMIPSDNEKPNEPMLQLHDMTDQYHKVSKGITATRLKLDALERSEARRLQDKKDGVWPTNGRKMEGTLVVIPGGGSVLLPNSTQSNTGDPKTSNASLVYVLSPGTAKTSTTTTIGGKTVYTVSRPPLVMSLAQLRQQNPNFRPAAMRGQLRPLSIRPSFRGVQTSSPGSSHRQGVPHVVRGTTLRGNPRAASARYASPRGTLTPPRASGPRSASSHAIYPPARMPHSPATRQPNAGIRPSGINSLGSPRMSHPRLPGSNTTVTRARMPGVRPAPPSIDSANLAPRPGQIRQRSTTSPRVQTPLPRPSPQPGSSPRHHTKSEPATPTYLSNSRSSSPHLPGNRLTSRSRPVSPRLQRADISQLLAAANNPISSLAAKQFQDSLAQEIADSQDLLEAHISALEKQLDEFERCSEKLDPTLQLGHVLYDLEQLKIFTQTV